MHRRLRNAFNTFPLSIDPTKPSGRMLSSERSNEQSWWTLGTHKTGSTDSGKERASGYESVVGKRAGDKKKKVGRTQRVDFLMIDKRKGCRIEQQKAQGAKEIAEVIRRLKLRDRKGEFGSICRQNEIALEKSGRESGGDCHLLLSTPQLEITNSTSKAYPG